MGHGGHAGVRQGELHRERVLMPNGLGHQRTDLSILFKPVPLPYMDLLGVGSRFQRG